MNTRNSMVGSLVGWVAAYVVVLAAAALVALKTPITEPWRSLVMLLPLLPAAGILRWQVRAFRNTDEMQIRHQIEALGYAFGAGAFLMIAYALLEAVGWPRLPMFVPYLVLMGIWIACVWIQRLRFR